MLPERSRAPLALRRAIEAASGQRRSGCRRAGEEASPRDAAKVGGFIDEMPDEPLMQARYDKDYALELVQGTGWEVVSLDPPQEHIQHAMVCRPV